MNSFFQCHAGPSRNRREFLGEIGRPMLSRSQVTTRRSSSLICTGGFPSPAEPESGDRLTGRRAPENCSAARKPALSGHDSDHRSLDGSRFDWFSPPALISGERPEQGPGSTLVHEDANSTAVGCRHDLFPRAVSQLFYGKSGMDGDAVFGLHCGCLLLRRRVRFDRPAVFFSFSLTNGESRPCLAV
jgi:hypothetical protein